MSFLEEEILEILVLEDQSTSEKRFQGLLATPVWVLRPFLTQRPAEG